MYDTVLTVLGNVGSDVRQVLTSQGTPLATFRLACTPRRPDRSGAWVDGPTTWYRVSAWRALAENVATSVVKGDPVLVHGRLRTSTWEKDGRSGETLEIDALAVGPDLSRGRTVFRKTTRTHSAAAGADTPAGGPSDHDDAGTHDDDAGSHDDAGTQGDRSTRTHPVESRSGAQHSAEPEPGAGDLVATAAG